MRKSPEGQEPSLLVVAMQASFPPLPPFLSTISPPLLPSVHGRWRKRGLWEVILVLVLVPLLVVVELVLLLVDESESVSQCV
jgi:hypothetical protein